MSVTVLKPGLLTTIQDNGRYGYQKYGVVVSGAMDTYAMRLGNVILGNKENDAVLEMTLVGPSLKIEGDTLISLTGGDLDAKINGEKVPMGRPVYIKETCILSFTGCKSGSREYLAIAGGFKVKEVMGSKSTYLRGQIGGKAGRALRKDDVLEAENKGEISLALVEKLSNVKSDNNFVFPRWYVEDAIYEKQEVTNIKVFKDRQFNNISNKSIEDFFSKEFLVDGKSDRMGYRLKGPKIGLKESMEMISEEVSFGTIQVPPSGELIVLLADRGTSGGYPKIAHVAACELKKLVQLKPNDKLKFEEIDIKKAEELYFNREAHIKELKIAVKLMSL